MHHKWNRSTSCFMVAENALISIIRLYCYTECNIFTEEESTNQQLSFHHQTTVENYLFGFSAQNHTDVSNLSHGEQNNTTSVKEIIFSQLWQYLWPSFESRHTQYYVFMLILARNKRHKVAGGVSLNDIWLGVLSCYFVFSRDCCVVELIKVTVLGSMAHRQYPRNIWRN